MKKRILATILAVAMTLSMVACGTKPAAETPDAPAAEEGIQPEAHDSGGLQPRGGGVY